MIFNASSSDSGSGWMPIARRSASVSSQTSSLVGSPSVSCCSMPSRPAASSTEYARYGLATGSSARNSMRAELPLPGLYCGMRSSAERLLCPQQM